MSGFLSSSSLLLSLLATVPQFGVTILSFVSCTLPQEELIWALVLCEDCGATVDGLHPSLHALPTPINARNCPICWCKGGEVDDGEISSCILCDPNECPMPLYSEGIVHPAPVGGGSIRPWPWFIGYGDPFPLPLLPSPPTLVHRPPMPEGATLSDAACKALFVANVFASSCALQMFFLYRILLLPNQFETYF